MENITESDIYTKAEISIRRGKEKILQSIPHDSIIAIYVKGSYVQKAMLPGSDVDMIVILKDEEYLPALYELSEKSKDREYVPFSVSGYTLDELQTGKFASNRTKSPTSISSTVKHMDQLLLIYGSKPEGELFTRTDTKDLTALLSAFKKGFLPDYEKGTFKFGSIIKQVLWLTEREQRALGKVPDYNWQKLADSIEDKDHIIHMAMKLRNKKEISKEEKEIFMNKLSQYIAFLTEKYSTPIKS